MDDQKHNQSQDLNSEQQDDQMSSPQPAQPNAGMQERSRSKNPLVIALLLAVLLVIMSLAGALAYILLTKDSKPDTSTNVAESNVEEAATSRCLIASDFDNLYRTVTSAERPSTIDWSNPITKYTANVHFQPGTTTFADNSVDAGAFTPVATFYKENSSKSFVIYLRGSVASNDPSFKTLAKQRAQKMKGLLTAEGVPASRVIVKEPRQLSSSGGDINNDIDRSIARNVVLTIDPTCD